MQCQWHCAMLEIISNVLPIYENIYIYGNYMNAFAIQINPSLLGLAMAEPYNPSNQGIRGEVRGSATSESPRRIRLQVIRGTEVPRTSIPRSDVRQFAARAGPIPRYQGNRP